MSASHHPNREIKTFLSPQKGPSRHCQKPLSPEPPLLWCLLSPYISWAAVKVHTNGVLERALLCVVLPVGIRRVARVVTLCVNGHRVFVRSSHDGHLVCFQFGALKNKALWPFFSSFFCWGTKHIATRSVAFSSIWYSRLTYIRQPSRTFSLANPKLCLH